MRCLVFGAIASNTEKAKLSCSVMLYLRALPDLVRKVKCRLMLSRCWQSIWSQFDGASTLCINKIQMALLALAMTYPDVATMERGLANLAKFESRDLLPEFSLNILIESCFII